MWFIWCLNNFSICLILTSYLYSFKTKTITMSKDDRSPLNPFTGKKHYDNVNDDIFLQECFREYYETLNNSQILDNTDGGVLISSVATKLIIAVRNYLASINRLDYVDDYYEWEFHLLLEDAVNAFCIPGGKIVVFSGILSILSCEDELAFILGHEMAHALLDHTRTRVSAQSTKDSLATVSWIGSFAFDILGMGEIGSLTRAAVNTVDVGSQFLLLNPWGRDQELEADRLGMFLIHYAGYDISGVPAFWRKMSAQNANNFDFFSTHPADDKRIAAMESFVLEIEQGIDYSRPILDQITTSSTIPALNQGDYDKVCSSCGAGNSDDSRFCTNCGHEFTNELRCPNCNSMVSDDSKFCTNCGFKLSDNLKCLNCGSTVGSGDIFCTVCGNKL